MFQPLMETGFLPWTNILLVLLVCNVIWVGYVTVNQKRLDLLLGNSSVMHMGYIFLAFAALVVSGSAEANPWALKGAALLMLAHGLTIALLFLLCGQIEKQTGTLEINSLGGLSTRLPCMAFVFGLAGMASIGPPASPISRGIHGLLLRFRRFQQRLRPRSNRHHPVPLGTGHRRGIHAEGLPQIFSREICPKPPPTPRDCSPPNGRPTASWSSPWRSSASSPRWCSSFSPDFLPSEYNPSLT